MTIYVPGAMLGAGISLYLFYEYNRVKEGKLIKRRESLNDLRRQYLRQLIEVKKKEYGTAEDPPPAPSNEGTSGSGDLP
jgi:hypothetical protein